MSTDVHMVTTIFNVLKLLYVQGKISCGVFHFRFYFENICRYGRSLPVVDFIRNYALTYDLGKISYTIVHAVFSKCTSLFFYV
jgi:hypothetical protein